MWKELPEENVKVSQSMPSLTNTFQIGREVVKSNIAVDDKDDGAIRSSTTICTTLLVNTHKKTRC